MMAHLVLSTRILLKPAEYLCAMVPIVEEDLEVHVGNIGARGPNCGETGSETILYCDLKYKIFSQPKNVNLSLWLVNL